MKLGGSMIIHNAVEFDYCVEIALRSLLPICDEVVVLDAESTDGTRTILDALAREFPNLVVTSAPWKPNPGGWGSWLADLSNLAKSHLRDCTHHIALQADEVLEDCRVAAFRHYIEAHPCLLHRLNFWIDNRHLVPSGKVCNDWPLRCATIDRPYVGDAESLDAIGARPLSAPRIFHYGMIRRTKAFVAKSKPMQSAFTGGPHDPMLNVIEKEPVRGFEQHIKLSQCPRFDEPHPLVARQWLRERGYVA